MEEEIKKAYMDWSEKGLSSKIIGEKHKDDEKNIVVKEVMSLKLAVKLIETVEEKAAEMGLAVVVAVSDASGRPIAVHCMDGAYHGSFDVAVNKTYTSTAFQMSTAKLSRLCQPGQDLVLKKKEYLNKVIVLCGILVFPVAMFLI